MRRFLSLVRVNLIMSLMNSGTMFSLKNAKKKAKKFSRILLWVAVVALLVGLFGVAGFGMARSYQMAGILSLFPNLVILEISLLILLSNLSFLTSTLFSGEDTKFFLSMPLKPGEIVGAKLLVLLLEAYLIEALIALPMAIGGLVAAFDLRMLLMWILLFPILPIVPTCIVTVFLLLLLKWIPPLRKEKMLVVFSSIFAIAGAFTLSFFMNNTNLGMGAGFLSGGGGLSDGLSGVFMPALFFAQSLFFGSLPEAIRAFVLLFLLSGAWVIVSTFIVSRTYFSVLLNMHTEGVRKKRSGTRLKSDKVKSPFSAMIHREVKMILRTPVYLLNGAIFPLLFILIMVLSIVVGSLQGNLPLGELLVGARNFFGSLQQDAGLALNMGLIAALIITTLSTMGSMISSTFTRDAHHFDFLKSLPLDPWDIIVSKMLGSAVFLIPPALLLMVLALFLIPLDVITYVSMILGLVAYLFGDIVLDLFVDLRKPKTNWMNETMALKMNKNVAFAMMLRFILVMLMIPFGITGHLREGVIIYGIVSIGFGLGLLSHIRKNARKLMQHLGEGA